MRCKSSRPARRTSAAAFVGDPPEPDDPLLSFAPYLHKAPRRNSITPERQRAFIAMLAATGIVTQAARHVGASLETLYSLRHRAGAEGFSAAWDMALDRGMARLEDCALERAILGEERPIVSFGQVLGSWRRYDTTLITFLLRQRRSDRFRAGSGLADLRPGHPVYDRLKSEWQEEDRKRRAAESEAVVLSINAKLEQMRQRMLEAEAERAAAAEEEDEEDG